MQLSDKFDVAASKIVVHHSGLSNRNGSALIQLSTDGSKVVAAAAAGQDVETVRLETLDRVFYGSVRVRHSGMVDFLYVNCEGCEYDLLPDIINTRIIASVRRLHVQFHLQDSSAQSVHRRCLIREALRKTHEPVFAFPFVWEGWVLKGHPV